MPFTKGFASTIELEVHFSDHGHEFGATSADEYGSMADGFLGGPIGPNTLESVRKNGDRLRYDPTTDEFGVLRRDMVIKTYFVPDPTIHGWADNFTYFRQECLK